MQKNEQVERKPLSRIVAILCFQYSVVCVINQYEKNARQANRSAFMLDDKELIKSLSSAKNCYHIFKSVGDEDNAQFFQMYYWEIKREISHRWRGI